MDNKNNAHPLIFFKLTVWPWFICLLAALFYFYDFMLRVLPSVMIHPLMNSYGVNATSIGVISACYYYAYTPLQLPAGIIADKYSPRLVLALSCMLCALGTIVFAITHHFYIACFARAMMGIGSAFAFVGALKLAAVWLPENRFAFFAGLTTSIGTLGAVAVDNILTSMVYDLGWQHTAFLLGLWGLALSALLYLFIRKKPHANPVEHKQNNTWASVFKRLGILAKTPYIWINGLVGLIMFLPITVFASLWGVDFLNRAYHLKNAQAASAVSLVFIGLAIASPFAGLISEGLKSRKIPLFVGSLGCFVTALVIIYIPHLPMPSLYILLFMFGAFASPQVLTFAMSKDLSPAGSTGMATAMTNFIITIGAGVYQPLIGYALDYTWNGARTEFGTPMFSIANYQFAFSFLMASFLISSLLILTLPKTRNQLTAKDYPA